MKVNEKKYAIVNLFTFMIRFNIKTQNLTKVWHKMGVITVTVN